MSLAEQTKRLPLVDLVKQAGANEDLLQSLRGVHDLHDRSKAIERFSKIGLPKRGEESWKYTDVAPLRDGSFCLPAGNCAYNSADIRQLVPDGLDHVLVFVDGLYHPELSVEPDFPPGVLVGSLAQLVSEGTLRSTRYRELRNRLLGHPGSLAGLEQSPLVAMNASLLKDGCYLYLPEGVQVKQALCTLQLSSGGAVLGSPRTLVFAAEGASATLVELQFGSGSEATYSNSVTEFVLGENANVEHVRIQGDAAKGVRVAGVYAELSARSRFHSHTLTFGGELVRNETGLRLTGGEAHGEVNGLYMLDGNSHVDNHTLVDHVVPDCTSNQLFKGILQEKAQGVFTGRVHVHQDAQNTDAMQSSASLLLSDEARSWARPQLEIYADDVRCSHGATVGSLDQDALFYLRSRGIGLDRARRLLVHAFASEVLSRVQARALLPLLDRLIRQQMSVSRRA